VCREQLKTLKKNASDIERYASHMKDCSHDKKTENYEKGGEHCVGRSIIQK